MAKKNTTVTESIPPKVVKVSEEPYCSLNPVEWNSRAQELADAQKEAEQLKERKKSVTADLNADVKMAETKVSKLANVVTNHKELRDVTVEVKFDYDLGVVIKTRTDTKEVISEREMTDSERQSELELQDATSFIEGRHEEADTASEDAPEDDEAEEE